MIRKLDQIGAAQAGLGAPTIMDRALAARHGAAYVRLAVMAIDLDRAYGHDPDPDGRPLGWEVFLLECYVLEALEPDAETTRALLEDICMGVLEQPPDAQALGSQIVFAVHDAVRRGALPESLRGVFHRWRAQPKQLTAALDGLFAQREARRRELAGGCLQIALEPPLSDVTRGVLEAWAR